MKQNEELPEINMMGLSHKTAPVDVREKFCIEDTKKSEFMMRAREGGIEEIVLLTTCNRVEVYFTACDIASSFKWLKKLFEEYTGLRKDDFINYLYKKYSRDAVLHLFSVTSSLDSMVIGENEIFGQVKDAFRNSVMNNMTGFLLNRLFHQAFNTGKKVKSDTGISQNPVSIAYIAVEKAKQLFHDFSNRKALLIGAGEMAELILKYFTKNSMERITVANRSVENASRIVKDLDCSAAVAPLEDIGSYIQDADVIISSTACQEYLVTLEMTQAIREKRNGRPLFLIDISVPRNIDPDVSDLDFVHLYNIDDLENIADENTRSRLREVDRAQEIVYDDVTGFFNWYEEQEIIPIIVKLKKHFDDIRAGEIERYRRRRLKHLDDEDFAVVEDLTRQIMTKTLHNPIMALKQFQAAKINGHYDMESIIGELFKK